MKRQAAVLAALLFFLQTLPGMPAGPYTVDTVVPKGGGCPQPDHQNISPNTPVNRRWSTSLAASPPTILTVAPNNSQAQLDEIEGAILDSFGAWTGVTGTTVNINTNPGALAPLGRVPDQNACENDQGTNTDGFNSVCFNQASDAFTFGVLAFTRSFVADAPGESVGGGPPSAFAGQILDADVLFRPDGQATFATPGALPMQPGAYDLESLLTHELGHLFGVDHSGVWRAMMFPFAPPPGTFLGDRPTQQKPDGPLADDDRAGLRTLYPDPGDTVNVGVIGGRVLPANPFALALEPQTSMGESVTGMFGPQVVALDADTGAVVAGTLAGWTCDPLNPPTRFDGTYQIERLPVGGNYKIYAEPFDGLVQPGDMSEAVAGLCRPDVNPPCTTPAFNTNFNPRTRPPGQ
jgi:Matrixin